MTWMAASAGLGLEDKERDPLNLEPGQPPDGLDNLDAPPLNLRFGKDLRLVEVSLHSCSLWKLLRSSWLLSCGPVGMTGCVAHVCHCSGCTPQLCSHKMHGV